MTKPVRFPRKLEVWVPEAMADAFELLAADGLLNASDHLRQALARYLAALNVPMKPKPNGRTADVAAISPTQEHQEASLGIRP